MKVERIGSELMPDNIERQQKKNNKVTVEAKTKDYLEISFEGRKKLSELADKKLNESQTDKANDLSGKFDKIRNKISDGFYKTDEVKQIIADKLIKDIFDEPKE